jgi:hypothetical protein
MPSQLLHIPGIFRFNPGIIANIRAAPSQDSADFCLPAWSPRHIPTFWTSGPSGAEVVLPCPPTTSRQRKTYKCNHLQQAKNKLRLPFRPVRVHLTFRQIKMPRSVSDHHQPPCHHATIAGHHLAVSKRRIQLWPGTYSTLDAGAPCDMAANLASYFPHGAIMQNTIFAYSK